VVPQVIAAIDGIFRNTDAETLTETEKAFEQSFQSLLGNVKGLVLSVTSVVVFMILLVSGNTMAMNLRERTHEIAILKTLGFRNESIIGILIGESMLIAMLGGLVGTIGAKLLFASVDMSGLSQGFLARFTVEPLTVALGMGIAGLVGLIAGGVPALHVTRMTVSEGLRLIG